MKLLRSCIAAPFLLLALTGCSQKPAQTEMAPSDIVSAIAESQANLPALTTITSEHEDFATWLTDYYLIPSDQVADGSISYAEGVEASEIAVLRMEKEEDCKTAETALKEYLKNRAGIFEGYAPQQAALVKNGAIAVNGCFLSLMICPDTGAAKAAFSGCFGDTAKKADIQALEKAKLSTSAGAEKQDFAKAEDSYDPEAILQAWRTGDDSALSEKNRRILNAAKDVLEKNIDSRMSDYEKELAVHDWITDWSSFDYSVFGRSASKGFKENSDTPYGVFIDRSAMCHGYSSTFQLLMDMLDIECITVYGIPGSNGVEHSWNMVKLDGEWYCVDVAWDDPIGGTPGHTYFNVTSKYLRDSGIHSWEEGSVPEATATAYRFGSH